MTTDADYPMTILEESTRERRRQDAELLKWLKSGTLADYGPLTICYREPDSEYRPILHKVTELVNDRWGIDVLAMKRERDQRAAAVAFEAGL